MPPPDALQNDGAESDDSGELIDFDVDEFCDKKMLEFENRMLQQRIDVLEKQNASLNGGDLTAICGVPRKKSSKEETAEFEHLIEFLQSQGADPIRNTFARLIYERQTAEAEMANLRVEKDMANQELGEAWKKFACISKSNRALGSPNNAHDSPCTPSRPQEPVGPGLGPDLAVNNRIADQAAPGNSCSSDLRASDEFFGSPRSSNGQNTMDQLEPDSTSLDHSSNPSNIPHLESSLFDSGYVNPSDSLAAPRLTRTSSLAGEASRAKHRLLSQQNLKKLDLDTRNAVKQDSSSSCAPDTLHQRIKVEGPECPISSQPMNDPNQHVSETRTHERNKTRQADLR